MRQMQQAAMDGRLLGGVGCEGGRGLRTLLLLLPGKQPADTLKDKSRMQVCAVRCSEHQLYGWAGGEPALGSMLHACLSRQCGKCSRQQGTADCWEGLPGSGADPAAHAAAAAYRHTQGQVTNAGLCSAVGMNIPRALRFLVIINN